MDKAQDGDGEEGLADGLAGYVDLRPARKDRNAGGGEVNPDKPVTHGTHSGKKLSTCGCMAAHCCLSCPLPVCVLEVPARTQKSLHREAMVKEMKAAGKDWREITEELGISKRTLYRRGTG